MYNIAICEDKRREAEELAAMTRSILAARDIPYRLDLYESCRELLDAVDKRKKSYDMLLLDILMEGLNGIEFAKRLRKVNQRTSIAFITATMDFVLEGYTVRAMRYLHKPVTPADLRGVLEEDYAMRFRYIPVRVEGGERRVRLHQLLYLESRGHKVVCHLTEDVVEAYPPGGSFAAMADTLPGELVRCHRCYIVNIHMIRDLRRSAAVMENGMEVPVGRKWFNQVQDAYFHRNER